MSAQLLDAMKNIHSASSPRDQEARRFDYLPDPVFEKWNSGWTFPVSHNLAFLCGERGILQVSDFEN